MTRDFWDALATVGETIGAEYPDVGAAGHDLAAFIQTFLAGQPTESPRRTAAVVLHAVGNALSPDADGYPNEIADRVTAGLRAMLTVAAGEFAQPTDLCGSRTEGTS